MKAQEFDRRFDVGEDISKEVDWGSEIHHQGTRSIKFAIGQTTAYAGYRLNMLQPVQAATPTKMIAAEEISSNC